MDKKAVEMSMNVIVIAALVLIVLIVLTFLMTGKLGWFSSKMRECEGIPMPSNEACVADGGIPKGQYYTSDGSAIENNICCVGAGSEERVRTH